ncbi:MAG TPA: hypothetical protein VFO89_11505, partial [Thermoanaerobaculia bacterium]|nr:hypothetical protein [Thermoanaerobaculia bacterium]
MRRSRLRTRVLLLTGVFTLALFGITFGLSWRARLAQERWTRLVSVETKAVAVLEELIRAQNGFAARFAAGAESPRRYRVVVQLLDDESMARVDVTALRGRVRAYRELLHEPSPRPEDLAATSQAIVDEAQSIIASRKGEIARQLPALERE